MNRNELVRETARKAGKTVAEVRAIVDALESTVTETLVKGETIKLIGFGICSVKTTRARQSRNPKTGEAIAVGARKLPVFKFSPAIAEALEEKDGE